MVNNISIYFDGTLVSSDAIRQLHRTATLFNDSFVLGSTVCNEIKLDVDKRYVTTQPSVVTIKSGTTLLMTLYVDNIDKENELYYSYTLYDNMMKLNTELRNVIPDGIELTVENILGAICDYIGSTTPEIEYGGDIHIIWNEDQYCRDFLSWVAEINCSFAKIDASGNLIFVKMNRESVGEVDVESCADIKIGEHHVVERVCYEQGVATVYYPEETTEELDTLYLNENNPLFTDTDDYSIADMVRHVYDEMVGFEFYNLKTSKCAINVDADAGDIITFVNGDDEYPTIAQIDQSYNTQWQGGYDLQVDNKRQEVTTVKKMIDRLNRVRILVDRANAKIEQVVSDAEGHVGSFALYLNEDNDHQVMSVINASADNIILNTKSLIFGEYPDGKYVEVRNNVSKSDILYMYKADNTPHAKFEYNEEVLFSTAPESKLKFKLVNDSGGHCISLSNLSIYKVGNKLQFRFNAGGYIQTFNSEVEIGSQISMNTPYNIKINNDTGRIKFYDDKEQYLFDVEPPDDFPSGYENTGFNIAIFSDYSSTSMAIYKFSITEKTEDDIYKDWEGFFWADKEQESSIFGQKKYLIFNNIMFTDDAGLDRFIDLQHQNFVFQSTGVTFTGSGMIEMDVQEKISLVNHFGSDYLNRKANIIDMELYQATPNSVKYPVMRLANYSPFSPYHETRSRINEIIMTAGEPNGLDNSINITNYYHNYGSSGRTLRNRIFCRTSYDGETSSINLENYRTASNLINTISLIEESDSRIINLYNYDDNGSVVMNRFIMRNNDDGSSFIEIDNKYTTNEVANMILMNNSTGVIRIANGRSNGVVTNRIDISSVDCAMILRNNDASGNTQNYIQLHATNGLYLHNQYSNLVMDMSGNSTWNVNNTLTLRSYNYCVVIRAEDGIGAPNAGRILLYAPNGVYYNGTRKW